MLLDIEEAYTEQATSLSREWEIKYVRDMTRKQIREAENVNDLAQTLIKLDRGFSHPF